MKKSILFIPIAFFFYQCAQMVSPTGGKKDEDPPNLVSSIPENKAVNYKNKVITLTFDEYVAIDNLIQKLIITPEAENTYTPQIKNQTVILKFKNPFADSTTYTFNFSDGIKDIAERNPAQNLKLVFSTGPTIDSGRVYGTIKDIRTNQPVFDALVGLYQLSDTLDPQKNKPYYFSRTDSSGVFSIENTQIATYSLIAFTDKNRNLLYNPKEESMAFLDSIIHTSSDTSHYELSLFHSDLTPMRVQRTIPKVNDYSMVFNKGIDSLSVQFETQPPIPYFLESPTQIKFFNIPTQTDTVRTNIHVVDSLGYALDVDQKIAFLPQRGKERQIPPFSAKNSVPTGEALDKNISLEIIFNKPVSQFDNKLVSITADSAIHYTPEQIQYSWSADSTQLELKALNTAKDSLIVNLEKGTFISIEGDTLQNTKYKYAVLDPSDFGTVKGTVSNPSNRPFFIELLDKDFKTVIQTIHSTPFILRNVKPGSYKLRLILDDNRNGRWDTGNYARKKQPEQIIVFPNELLIKSNFEYEAEYFTIPSK